MLTVEAIKKHRDPYRKFSKPTQPTLVDLEIQRASNCPGLSPVPEVKQPLQNLDPEKMPSHIFFLGSSGDGPISNDIKELSSNLSIKTRLINNVSALNYHLGDTSSKSLKLFQKIFKTAPLDLKSLKNPPLILVDPSLYLGPDSFTARKNQGKDLVDLLNDLIRDLGLNQKQTPRIMIVKPSEIDLQKLKTNYPATLDSYPDNMGSWAWSKDGLFTVNENDLKEILARYQKSL